MGKHFFNWHHFQIDKISNFFHGRPEAFAVLIGLSYYAVVSLLFGIGFLGQIPLFERCLRGAPRPTLSVPCLAVNAEIYFLKVVFSTPLLCGWKSRTGY